MEAQPKHCLLRDSELSKSLMNRLKFLALKHYRCTVAQEEYALSLDTLRLFTYVAT